MDSKKISFETAISNLLPRNLPYLDLVACSGKKNKHLFGFSLCLKESTENLTQIRTGQDLFPKTEEL